MTAELTYIIPKRSAHIGAWLLLGVFCVPVIFLALLLMGAAVALNWLLYGLCHTWRDRFAALCDWIMESPKVILLLVICWAALMSWPVWVRAR